jgi:hypothetical protein
MSITANYPNLRPSLLLDFANSQQLDQRITFSRSTTAPYYDGKTSVLAEQNLLLQSDNLLTGWATINCTTTGGQTDPIGGATAFKLVCTNGGNEGTYNSSGGTTTTGFTYTFSGWFRADSAVTLNINNTSNGGGGNLSLTTSWQYLSINAFTVTSTGGLWIKPTSTVAVYVWHPQLEIRNTPTAYNATTTTALTNYIPVLLTAPINSPRFDFNPTTGESLGLLIEQNSTNTLLNSSTFGGWVTDGAVTLLAQNIFIDGTQTLNILGQGTGNNRLYQFDNSGTLGSKTFSFYAKQYTGSTVTFSVIGGTTATGTVTFNLNTGTASGGTNYTTNMTLVGNGLYRCSVTISVSVASGNSTYFIIAAPTNQIFIGGFQYEALAFPTSYIPTTSAQVTRAADVAQMTGTNFSSWYNQNQGTLYSEVSVYNTSAAAMCVATLSDGTTNNRMELRPVSAAGSVNSRLFVVTSNSAQADIQTTVVNVFQKISAIIQSSNFILSVAGASGTAVTTGQIPSVNQLTIGNSPATLPLNGRIKKLAYYSQVVTQTQNQSLTGS